VDRAIHADTSAEVAVEVMMLSSVGKREVLEADTPTLAEEDHRDS
jgi:hypothetical protein